MRWDYIRQTYQEKLVNYKKIPGIQNKNFHNAQILAVVYMNQWVF